MNEIEKLAEQRDELFAALDAAIAIESLLPNAVQSFCTSVRAKLTNIENEIEELEEAQ